MKETKKFDKWIRLLSISVIAIVVLVFIFTISGTRLAKGTYGASNCVSATSPTTEYYCNGSDNLYEVGSNSYHGCCPAGSSFNIYNYTNNPNSGCFVTGSTTNKLESYSALLRKTCGGDKTLFLDKYCCTKGTTYDSSSGKCCQNSVNCGAGKYLDENNTCYTCDKGYYCPDGTNEISCASGYTTSGTGSTKESDCVKVQSNCGVGKYLDENNTCYTCDKGYYCPDGINEISCTSGYTTSGTGSTKASDCFEISATKTITLKIAEGTSGNGSFTVDTSTNKITSFNPTINCGTWSTKPCANGNCSTGASAQDSAYTGLKNGVTYNGPAVLYCKAGTSIHPSTATPTTPTVKPSTTPTVKPSTTPTVKPSTTPTVKPSTTSTVKPSTSSSPRDILINPPTGMIGLILVWTIGIMTICYAFWYFRKSLNK